MTSTRDLIPQSSCEVSTLWLGIIEYPRHLKTLFKPIKQRRKSRVILQRLPNHVSWLIIDIAKFNSVARENRGSLSSTEAGLSRLHLLGI
ncbi:hypothetical protein OPQ81_002770 [Rhizoctonia solani]|nr:hypothetical protein OPQ81_002770 [Rhizoctonia solani]